jgi:hypothetical protein
MGSVKRNEAAGVATAELMSYGRPMSSVFDLLGRRETDLTAALGWVLARSRRLRDTFLVRCGIAEGGDVEAVRLETADDDGRTDIELVREGALVVVEAKRGWQLPTVRQLEIYSKRVVAAGGGMLITLSDASPAWAAHVLPGVIDGVPIQHVPWSAVLDDIHAAASAVRGSERRWLGELRSYLRKVVHVHDPASGWAYCVVVSDATPGWGGERTYREYVTEADTYFHPFGWGKGWPTEAPNFMAFRHRGNVIRVSRVVDAEIVPTITHRWPGIEPIDDAARPHAVYTLGPALPLPAPVPSGTNYRAARLWVLIDQLLVCDTLKDAVEQSHRITGAT